MRTRLLWPLGIILLALLSGPACEDDPHDLDYLKAGSGGTSAAGAQAAGSAAGSAAGASGASGAGGS
jgi:hypothetical protein